MRDDTKLVHMGSHPSENKGAINPPVVRGSTMVFPSLAALRGDVPVPYEYGIYGTDTAEALREAVKALECAYAVELVPSGLSSISTVLLGCLRGGDHALVTHNVYYPTRRFCDLSLSSYGIEVEYFDPLVGGDICDYIRPNTKLIWLESPGSLTFEVHDTRAIVSVARERGILTALDNTWSGGYFYKPLEHGIDISIQAGTKYIGGHSDVLFGTIACASESVYSMVHRAYTFLGLYVPPDEVYLGLRGLRTMGVRLRHHEVAAKRVAEYLFGVPEVVHVMHPGLVGDVSYDLWSRDFTGSCGLFGFVMECSGDVALAGMLDGMGLFRMGYSWGGFESLILPTDPNLDRCGSVGVGGLRRWGWERSDGYQTMRLHIGLEDVGDLIGDLEAGFERLRNS